MDSKSGAYQAMVWITVCALLCFVISAMSVAVTIRNKIDKDYKPLKSDIEANTKILKELAALNGLSSNTKSAADGSTFGTSSPFYQLNKTIDAINAAASALAVSPQAAASLFAKNTSKTPNSYVLPNPRGGLAASSGVSITKTYLPPQDNETTVNDSWLNSILRVIESNYVRNGIKKGYLKEGQWVSFSRQYVAAMLIKQCEESSKNKPTWCVGGLDGTNGVTLEGVESEILYYAQELIRDIIVPASLCEYTADSTDGDSTIMCKNGTDADKISADYALPMGDVSLAMYTKWEQAFDRISQTGGENAAMVFNFPLLSETITINCRTTNFTQFCSPASNLQKYSCLDSPGDECVDISIQTHGFGNGDFMLANEVEVSGLQSAILAGITLDTPIQTASVSVDGVKTGGVIVASPFGTNGHTLEYLLGFRNAKDEAEICDNFNMDPNTWMMNDVTLYQIQNPILAPAPHKPIINAPGVDASTKFYITRFVETDIPSLVDVYFDYLVPVTDVSLAEEDFAAVQKKTTTPASSKSETTDKTSTTKAKPIVTYERHSIVMRSFPISLLGAYFTPNAPKSTAPAVNSCYFYIIPFEYLNAGISTMNTVTVDEFHVDFPDSAYYSVACSEDDGSSNSKKTTTTPEKKNTNPKWCKALLASTTTKPTSKVIGPMPSTSLPKEGGNLFLFA